MRKYIGHTEVEDQRDPNKTEEQRNRGILARIAKVDGAIVEDIGIHLDLKLRAGDDREQIITGVREAAARLSTKLSPERQSTLNLILTRFDNNPHTNLPNHTPEDRQIIIRTLSQNPAKLDILAKMELEGGLPAFTGFEGDEICFDEIAKKMPNHRRFVNYQMAVIRAERIGAPLISEARYLKICNEYKISMDTGDHWVWINSEDRPDLLNSGRALKGFQGISNDGRSYVNDTYASFERPYGAFRCSLRVKIIR